MIKKYFTVFAILPTILLVSCIGKDEQKLPQDEQMKGAFLKNVRTIPAELVNQNQTLTLAGKVEYDPDKVINYISLINGIADRTYFTLGDKVQKGQNMLDIRSTEFTSLQSEKISAETDMKIAERELKTAQSMYEDGLLSERELLEAQGKLKQAQTAFDKTKTDTSVYGTNKGGGIFTVQAPISGYVVSKNISSGTSISEGGDPLFTIADLNTVWIVANVYAGNVQFVDEGMDVEITSFSYPKDIFYGKISLISQVFDPEEKVLKARIIMQNKDLKFKPEMSVVVTLKKEEKSKIISVPSEALIFDNNRHFVVIEESTEKFSFKEVVLQGHNKNISYIASGLNAGENVVIKNQLLIYSYLKGN